MHAVLCVGDAGEPIQLGRNVGEGTEFGRSWRFLYQFGSDQPVDNSPYAGFSNAMDFINAPKSLIFLAKDPRIERRPETILLLA